METRKEAYLAERRKYGANHYKPIEKAVFEKGRGIFIWDTEGNCYIDAAAGYSADNLGHNHPEIIRVWNELGQLDNEGRGPVNIVPNSFLTVGQAEFLGYACPHLGYDKTLAKNGGVDGVEVAIKLMLKWGYTKKGIKKDQAILVMFEGNFHGRTTTVVGGSSEGKYKKFFGPYAGNIVTIPYNDIEAVEAFFKKQHARIAGIMIEPIQGEGGVRIPGRGYLAKVYRLCRKHDIAFCADEIQTGLGRAGAMLASFDENVKPDIFVFGKSLGAGRIPVSAVFAKKEFMCFDHGEDGSTYGGSHIAMTLARTALQVTIDEGLCMRSKILGEYLLSELRKELLAEPAKSIVADIRGRGLMIGIELADGVSADTIVDVLLDHGVLTKDAHGVIRVTPPLVITRDECNELTKRIGTAFRAYVKTPKKSCGACSCEKKK